MAKSFEDLWNTEVKKLAEACVDPFLMEIFSKSLDYVPSEEEAKQLKGLSEKYRDVQGMLVICNVMKQIDTFIAKKRFAFAKLIIRNILSYLDSPRYLEKVFKGDTNSEEWKNRKALSEGLHKLFDAE